MKVRKVRQLILGGDSIVDCEIDTGVANLGKEVMSGSLQIIEVKMAGKMLKM